MPFNIGDTVYDIRNINSLDVTQKYNQKGVITELNEITGVITHSNSSVTVVPIEYIASVALIEGNRNL
jgi:hypothetical protein